MSRETVDSEKLDALIDEFVDLKRVAEANQKRIDALDASLGEEWERRVAAEKACAKAALASDAGRGWLEPEKAERYELDHDRLTAEVGKLRSELAKVSSSPGSREMQGD